jgi:acetate kinase
MNVLTINSGSSSIKFSLYALGETEDLILKGELGRIGVKSSFFQIEKGTGKKLSAEEMDLPDHETAFARFLAWMEREKIRKDLQAVGHRLVHGGPDYINPEPVSQALIEDLKHLFHLAPEHLPKEIIGLEMINRHWPDLSQVACFDTAFHRSMPEAAQRYALPGFLFHEGLRRYGFHGLSYEFILQALAQEGGFSLIPGKLIIAHLGNGASMAAIENGQSRDTTMGLTPTGGLVMGTRAGDLDPGVPFFLINEKGMPPLEANHLINHQSGLLGISGLSADMKDLLAQEDRNAKASLAVEMFCYQARKFVGALAAVLGGLDTFVFTGGMGENSPPIRARICGPLEFLGFSLDQARNEANSPVISRPESPVTVRVIKTNEELMIARHTRDLLLSRVETLPTQEVGVKSRGN